MKKNGTSSLQQTMVIGFEKLSEQMKPGSIKLRLQRGK
jgi:hypothetical protein